MEYLSGEHVIPPGVYQLTYNSAASGTGLLEISKNNGTTYQEMVDGGFSSSEDRVAYLGAAKYRLTLTGDAKLYLDPIL